MRYEEIKVGDSASFSKTISESDIYQFAGLTGDFNPVHVDATYAETTMFKERIAHGLLTGSFVSTVLGMKLPGSNSVYLSQSFSFKAPVKIGDTVTAKVTVLEKKDPKRILKLKTEVYNQYGSVVIDGEAMVMKLIK
ncbi:MaoC family dehydratase [Metabacillus iocasae]|uniref:3-hydroxybutyryl-CoA dehydratase n=1 Tax=Priestia iocasae TaxID=2291674 RepID=A0ABS2QXT3_9BACI|nr:3-hydroxybutyryl-CoA dehydratase [Metabacillus iocasae]